MPSISFVGSASSTSPSGDTSNTSFSIIKPSGVVSGDFMVAMLSFFGGSSTSERTITAPSGWSKVGEEYVTASGYPHQICVMTRTAGSSEPGSWSGSISTNAYGTVTLSVAYRNVIGIAASGVSSTGYDTSYSTATVNNAVSSNWRLTMGGYTSSSLNYEIDSNEVVERVINGRTTSNQDVQAGAWDSGGTIATGNTSRTVSRGANWASSCAWIGILDANDVTVTGDASMSLKLPVVANSAELSFDGSLAADLPLPVVSAAGIASPPEGTLGATITPTMSVVAAHQASGTLAVSLGITMGFVGETRQFGVRVVTPEAEYRVISPLRGDDIFKSRILEKRNEGLDRTGPVDVTLPMPTMDIQAKKVNIVYAQNIGDGGTTSFTVTHNLGSRDVLTCVYEGASPYEEVQPTSIEHTTTNSVTVTFPSAPSTNQYRVVVVYG